MQALILMAESEGPTLGGASARGYCLEMIGLTTTRRFGTVIQLTFAALSLWAVDAAFAAIPSERAGDSEPQLELRSSAAPAGNPLWQIPLGSLKVTQERPIFSVSRRPATPAVVAPVVPSLPLPPAPPPEPDRPPLSLVGIIHQRDGGIAIFQSGNTSDITRLKIGESYAGWSLTALKPREAIFDNGARHATLGFPVPGARQEPRILPTAAPAPAPAWLNGAKITASSPRSSQPSASAPAWLNSAPVHAVRPKVDNNL
jgi:general secretion pathway protein N